MAVRYGEARGPEGMRIYAIGDVHGRFDLLERMHAEIEDELARDRPDDFRIVHLGDYVDRGPDSRGVLEFLSRRMAAEPRILALAGNHDVGFVDFLASPSNRSLFARFGGSDTARSYGVEIDFSTEATTAEGAARLANAMPQTHRDLLGGLVRCVEFGDFFFCHAGIRPGIPLARQDPDDLIWIRGEFLDWTGLHPKLIVHGHTPGHEAEILPNRVNVDTMAFRTGRLTALVVEGGEKRLLQVGG